MGDGVPAARLLRPGRPGGGRGAAARATPAASDSPRILGAFNEETPDWLSFFMFTYFTDRDGKYQLGTLKESRVRPAVADLRVHAQGRGAPHVRRHHRRRPGGGADRELMREHDTDDVAALGGIPLAVIQKYLNFHYSVSLDLFGGETSTNVANYFTAGLKGRWQEERRDDDHVLTGDGRRRWTRSGDGGRAGARPRCPRWSALNHDLRREYIADCQSGIKRWNRILAEAGHHRSGCSCRTSASTARSARSPASRHHPGRRACVGRGHLGGAARRVAAHARPTRHTCESLMRPVYEPGQDRRLDRTAPQRHQRPAVRLRVRPLLSCRR